MLIDGEESTVRIGFVRENVKFKHHLSSIKIFMLYIIIFFGAHLLAERKQERTDEKTKERRNNDEMKINRLSLRAEAKAFHSR